MSKVLYGGLERQLAEAQSALVECEQASRELAHEVMQNRAFMNGEYYSARFFPRLQRVSQALSHPAMQVALKNVRKLEEMEGELCLSYQDPPETFLRAIAQIVHQAYHQDLPGTWRECSRGVCGSIRQYLREGKE